MLRRIMTSDTSRWASQSRTSLRQRVVQSEMRSTFVGSGLAGCFAKLRCEVGDWDGPPRRTLRRTTRRPTGRARRPQPTCSTGTRLVWRGKGPSELEVLAAVLRRDIPKLARVDPETNRLTL